MYLTFCYDNGELDILRASEPKLVKTLAMPEHVTVQFRRDKYRCPQVEVSMSHDVARLLYEQLKPLFEGSSDG